MIEIHKPDETLVKILPKVKLKSNVRYIPSQYALSFEHNGKPYVFNTLTKHLIEGELPESVEINQGYDEQISSQFLVPEDKDEVKYYSSVFNLVKMYNLKKGIHGYTILPTLACNARCVYCYEEGMKQVTMTPEIVEQTIRYIIETHRGDSVHLAWFGGEPLIGEKIIDRICEGLREAGISYTGSMISNASLITPKIVEKMAGVWNLEKIQVSMDGNEKDYIARKYYYHYRNDYHQVMESISAMSKAGIRVAIRCNVDLDNWDGIPEYLKDLKKGILHKENVSLYFGPLNQIRLSDKDLDIWKKIVESGPMIEETGIRAGSLMPTQFRFRGVHCMADAGSAVITPDGGLYPCEHCPAEARYGNIFDGITDAEAKKEFCRTDVIRGKCRACPFLPMCTSFSHCPIEDTHCSEVMKMNMFASLKRMIDDRIDDEAENDIVC